MTIRSADSSLAASVFASPHPDRGVGEFEVHKSTHRSCGSFGRHLRPVSRQKWCGAVGLSWWRPIIGQPVCV